MCRSPGVVGSYGSKCPRTSYFGVCEQRARCANRIETRAITGANQLTSPAPPPSVLRQRLWARARIRHLKMAGRGCREGVAAQGGPSHWGSASRPLSNVLADLESMLETPLFMRHARGMTDHARSVPKWCGLRDESCWRSTMSRSRPTALRGRREGSGDGWRPSAGRSPACWQRRFRSSHASNLRCCCSFRKPIRPQCRPCLRGGEVDLAVWRGSGIGASAAGTSTELIPDRFIVVAGPQHPLAGSRRVSSINCASSLVRGADRFGCDQGDRRTVRDRQAAAPPVPGRLSHPGDPAGHADFDPPGHAAALQRRAAVSSRRGSSSSLRWTATLPFEPLVLFEPNDGTGEAAAAMAQFLRRYAEGWRSNREQAAPATCQPAEMEHSLGSVPSR